MGRRDGGISEICAMNNAPNPMIRPIHMNPQIRPLARDESNIVAIV